MSFEKKLQNILKKHKELEEKVSDPSSLSIEQFAKFSKEYSDCVSLSEKINNFFEIKEDITTTKEMLEDSDLKKLAEEELSTLKQNLSQIEKDIRIILLPKDEADTKNAILEVRAGTGGGEAALFACDLFRMYQRFAEIKKWKFEVLSKSETGIGGYKEASAVISGKNVFASLKFESGVHRVQRIPETESNGRVHTSAATVAVLAEAEDIDIHIDEKELRIDVFRASGPGGQSVNTTDSAIRITHIPTGIVVSQQDEKSQHKNKSKAMKVLRSRVYELERQKKELERANERKGQIGSGDRSERIRTYNFPQGRVSDHRINLTLYKIDSIVREGNLEELISSLISEDYAKKLADFESN